MQLVIEHTVRPDERRHGQPLYSATFRLMDGPNKAAIPDHLMHIPVRTLASRWYAIYGSTSNQSDANHNLAHFVDDQNAMSKLINGLLVTSHEPLQVVAFEQQVKRACTLLAIEVDYVKYLRSTPQQILEVSSDDDLHHPLPRLSK